MLGICCQFIKEEVKERTGRVVHTNMMDERSLQLNRYKDGKYSADVIKSTYVNNVKNLATMLPRIRQTGVRLFRISSALFPLADQVSRELWDNDEVKFHLKTVGDYVKSHDMRVTTHPGQFCVLSSDSDKVIENTFKELSIHGWLFDEMGLEKSPLWSINIHGGKANRSSRLIEQIKSLPDNVRLRLTLENDELSYNVVDLLRVHLETGVPICLDSHHHGFNDGNITLEDAFHATKETWPNHIKPLQHLSNTDPRSVNGSFAERRKHSNMIHYVPACQLQGLRDDIIDVEIEAKFKNLSVFKMAQDFQVKL